MKLGANDGDVQMTDRVVYPSQWTYDQIAGIFPTDANVIAKINPVSLVTPLPGFDLWDMWPVQLSDGQTVTFDGWTIWMVLSAPVGADPDARHDIARIRLLTEAGGTWRDNGNALTDSLSPGSREWAGTAIYDPQTSALTLYYTATGHRGEVSPTYAQRIFSTSTLLSCEDGKIAQRHWSVPVECIVSDDKKYLLVGAHEGRPGFIKGFRDPAYFSDPVDGAQYLLFTGSLKPSNSAWNGCIGIARRDGDGRPWSLLNPLLSADGLNNEQERPHIVARDGRYYLFWSTQRRVFAPDGPNGPNGLYGMVADSVLGPYRPLNGSGLVAANPDEAPFQTYSWWVTADLHVHSFVDCLQTGSEVAVDSAEWRRRHFGGLPAPQFRIELDGDKAWVA